MKKFLKLALLILLPVLAHAQTVTVNWATKYQTIQGFGAGNNFVGTAMNPYDSFLFNTLGYSLLRSAVPISNGVCDGSPSPSCATAQDSVTDMQSCVSNGCSVWVYVSNPPPEYNSSGTVNCTVNPALNPTYYSQFATYVTNFVASLRTYQSIPPYAVSVQNEPDNTSACQMSAAQMDTFIKTNLGPTMSSASQTSTLIMMPEVQGFYDYTAWAATCMGDPSCANYVGINAFHGYDNPSSISNPYSKQFWETEVSDIGGPSPRAPGCAGNVWCPTISDALMWATIVSNEISEGLNAWHYFWYVDDDTLYGTDANVALINPAQSPPVSLRTYAIANWAKFVRPGWNRVGTTYSGPLLVTAFENPGANTGAIVAVNSTGSSAATTFSVGTQMGSAVTPWITSTTQNLVALAPVNVSAGSFTFAVPASSIVTFVGGAVSPPSSTTHYADYLTGNDSNAGTSTGAPWKHAPGMMGLTPAGASTGDGCQLNCSSYLPQPGDRIILKGGSVWPSTTAPWTFGASGSGSSSLYGCAGSGCIYIGNAIGAGLPAWNSGKVTSITLKRDLGGWSPSSPPSVSCSGGGGSGAAATAHVVPAAETNDPNIAGFIYHIALTSGGSGYTSVPSCTLTGGSGTATLVADIDRAIFDLGSTGGSPPVWQLGVCGTYPNTCAPFVITGAKVLASGIEVRNMLTTQSLAGGADSEERPFVDMQGANDTIYNFYVHGMNLNCVVLNTSCAGLGGNNAAIELEQPYDEASHDIVENGDVVFLATSGQQSAGICTTNYLCGTFAFGYMTGTQGGLGPVSVHDSIGFSNLWQLRLGGNDASGSDPYLSYNDEFWLTTYSANQGAHENARYSILFSPSTLYQWNNIVHSQVNGTSSQSGCATGQSYYAYNEVQWGIGTGTLPYSIGNGGDPGGCIWYLYNDTMYSNNTASCVNSVSVGTASTVTMQNLHCIMASAANPFWTTSTNFTYENYAGSSTSANVQAASTVQSLATANGQGYTAANAFAPTSTGNATVTFASGGGTANLTSLCSGYLTALCSDINGNARTNAGFQSGAYNFGGAMPSCTSPSISPASGSYVSPQTVTMLTPVGCAIFYTTDNTTPTCSSTAYTAGFSQSIVTTTYIQAIACQTGYTTSGVTINSYTLNATPPPVTPNPLLFVCAGTHATCCPAVAVATTQYCLSVDGLFLSSQGSQYAQMLIPGPAGAPGAPGPAGAQGVTGKTGATGPAGASGVLSVNSIKPAANGNVTITPTLSVTPK